MPSPTTEQRIAIIADFNSEKIAEIKSLMEDVFNDGRNGQSSYDHFRFNYFSFQDYLNGNNQFDQQSKQTLNNNL